MFIGLPQLNCHHAIMVYVKHGSFFYYIFEWRECNREEGPELIQEFSDTAIKYSL